MKKVIAFDIQENQHLREVGDFSLRASVYGILKEGEKVLMNRQAGSDKFGLPGGGIELGETIGEALEREFMEETGLIVKTKELVTVGEDFFVDQENNFQSILLFYVVERSRGKLESKDEESAQVEWMDLNSLTENKVKRIFWPVVAKINW